MARLMEYKEADDKLTALEGVTTKEFVEFTNEVLRLSPEYIDRTREVSLPNGVKRELLEGNTFLAFNWEPEKNGLVAVKADLSTFESRQKVKQGMRKMFLDYHKSGEWQHVFILTIPLVNDAKTKIDVKDCHELWNYLNVWARNFPTMPICAIGHADESEVYCHWHVLFSGQVSYSRSKRIRYLLEQEEARKRGH